jgi:hypothetical protein
LLLSVTGFTVAFASAARIDIDAVSITAEPKESRGFVPLQKVDDCGCLHLFLKKKTPALLRDDLSAWGKLLRKS